MISLGGMRRSEGAGIGFAACRDEVDCGHEPGWNRLYGRVPYGTGRSLSSWRRTGVVVVAMVWGRHWMAWRRAVVTMTVMITSGEWQQ